MEWDKVWAIGRETYLRVYPNPGIGLCVGNRRWSWGVHSGFYSFKRDATGYWRRA